MGNSCAHLGNNCVEQRSSNDGFCQPIFSPRKQQIVNGTQCGGKEAELVPPNKPPVQMIIVKEEKTKIQPEPPKGRNDNIGEEDETEIAVKIQKQGSLPKPEGKKDGHQESRQSQYKTQTRAVLKPAVVPEKPRKSHNISRLSSAGLLAESVLETKTSHLKEHYNLGRKLGHGQFGTTFLCIEKGTGKEYACKSIAKRKLTEEDDVEDVRREIQIMRHLSGQPDVILIKGAYEDSVAVHFVMELCEGGELFDRIVEKGHYTERKAAQLAKVIVGAVQTCHSLGLMHRDLKPENFLFVNKQEDSPLKLIDFGLSVFFKPGDVFTDVVGSPYYVAPEVLQKSYGPEADVWSAGAIIYVMLSGAAPFWGETEEEIFEEVLQGELDLSSDPWPDISESAKDLIRKMLERDPKKRLTADQVLCHPWIQDEGVASDKPLDSAILSRLKQFSAVDKLKKMALRVIAHSLPEDETHGLKEIFRMIDKDNSGQITYEELKDGLKRFAANLDESELHALLQAADVDNDGTIDYEEFIAATLHLNNIDIEEDHFLAVFSYFDRDGSGYITKDELQQVCEELGMGDIGEEMIQEVDQDNDGRIDYGEFLAMMKKGNTELGKGDSKGKRSFGVGVREAVTVPVC